MRRRGATRRGAFAASAIVIGVLSCTTEPPVGPTAFDDSPHQLEVVVRPTTAMSGVVFPVQPRVTILDQNRQLTNAVMPVSVSVTRGNATIVGTLTVNSVGGVAAFTDLKLNGGGDLTLTFTAEGLNPASFNLRARQQPVALDIQTQPDGAETGLPMTSQPVVRVLDAAGIPVSDSTFSVTVGVERGNGSVTGIATVATSHGTALYSGLRVTGTGVHALRFSAPGLAPVVSSDFVVVGATHLKVIQQPDTVLINAPFPLQPRIELRGPKEVAPSPPPDTNPQPPDPPVDPENPGPDAAVDSVEVDKLMLGASAPVTAELMLGNGTLTGTLTVNAVGGVATFTDLQIVGGSGIHQLRFVSDGLTVDTTATFFVTAPAVALHVDTVPAGAVSGLAFTTQPVVAIMNGLDQRAVSSTAAVTATLTAGSGTLQGTRTVNAVGGIARFTNLRIDGVGPHTLTFTAAGLTLATAGVTVTQAPASIAVLVHANGAVSGQQFSTQPRVRILDHTGLPILNSTLAVTAAILSGTGALSGTTTVNASGGVATFTNLSILGGGPHTLSFTAAGLPAVSSAIFSVDQVAVALGMQRQPAGTTTGLPFFTQPVVQVRDGAGGAMLSAGHVVTATLASGTGTLQGTTAVAAVNGSATFTNLSINGTGPHTLRFTAIGLTQIEAATIAVSQPPTTLAVQTEPAEAVSGRVFTTQPAVSLRDPANVTAGGVTAPVTAALASGTGTLSGTTTVNSAGGVAAFTNLRIDGVGPHTLVFTSPGLTPATSAAMSVTQAPVALGIETQPPGSSETGQVFSPAPVVRILDNGGVTVGGSTNSVTAAIESGTGTLSGTTTVDAVNGVATFNDLKITGNGSHRLQFTSAGLTPASSSTFEIAQTAAGMGVLTQPSGATIGLVLATAPVIEIRDVLNNRVTGSVVPVTVSVASGPGAISGTTTVNAVNGVATFSDVTISAPGSHTLTFTSPGLTTVTSAAFTVSEAAASASVQTQPAGAVSGLLFTTQPVVRILDGNGQLAGGFTGSVAVSIASGTGTLQGITSVAVSGGVATFTDLQINGIGSHTLSFAVTGLTGATTSAFTVTQTAFTLAVLTQPAGAVSGSVMGTQPVIRVLDHAGLRVEGSTAPITATLDGTGTLVGAATVNAVDGEATFTGLRIDGGGTFNLVFTSAGINGITSSDFTTTQTATELVVQIEPAGAVSGLAFTTQPRVRIVDATNSTVAGATTAVTAALTSGTGALAGTATVNAIDGVATFNNLRINGVGSHTLSFTAGGLPAEASAPFTVTQTPASLTVETQPSGAVSGSVMTGQPVVRVRDHAGLAIADATNTVTAVLTAGTGTLLGTTTVSASGGLASFTNLRLDGGGSHTLTFSSANLQSASANAITVTQVARALVIASQPSGATSEVPFTTQPSVRIVDDAGVQVAGATNDVSLNLGSGTGILSGTIIIPAVNGLATYSGIAINGSGPHTLTFSADGLTGATSNAFQVTGGSEFIIHESCTEYTNPSISAATRTFYVDATNGNDVNDGLSLSSAWRTLGRANAAVSAGDHVYLRGVFSGQRIQPAASGTALAKIVYQALPGDSTRIHLGSGGVGISIDGRSHIVVSRVAITNVATNPILINNSSHVWLFSLSIADGGSSVIQASDDNRVDRLSLMRVGSESANSGDGLIIRNGSDRNIVTRSTLKNVGHAAIYVGPTSVTDALSVDNVLAQNDVDNPWGTGIILETRAQGTILECNKIHNSASGSGLNAARSGLDVDGIANMIRYNDVYQNGVYGIVMRGRTYATSPLVAVTSQLLDNTISGNASGAVRVLLTFTP